MAGVSCTVFERETSETYITRPREWGMTLHWGAEFVLKKLPMELQEKLRSIRCNPYHDTTPGKDDFLPICNGITGEVMLKMAGDSPVRVSRRKMRELFSEGLDIRVRRSLLCGRISIDMNNTAPRSRPSSKTGLILRAMHLWAATALNQENTPRNKRFTYKLYTQMFKASYYPETTEMFWISIQDVPDPNKPETWLFQLVMGWGGSPTLEEMPANADRMRVFKERAQWWGEPWKTAGLYVKEDTQIYGMPATYWMPTIWDNHKGKITLAGDAAHPMPPGLNNAMQDASNLVDALANSAARADLGKAIDAYEAEMRERATKEVHISKEQATKVSDWKTFMDTPMITLGMKKQADEGAAK
ncbi:hypothetical protein MMC08_005103 [Hypocenomyce scalaris]|nr:hypothetical protein [Hypocenomyce scalaris]